MNYKFDPIKGFYLVTPSIYHKPKTVKILNNEWIYVTEDQRKYLEKVKKKWEQLK